MGNKELGVGASSALGQSWGTDRDVRIEVSISGDRLLIDLKPFQMRVPITVSDMSQTDSYGAQSASKDQVPPGLVVLPMKGEPSENASTTSGMGIQCATPIRQSTSEYRDGAPMAL